MGTLQSIPDKDSLIILAGKRWKVERVDEKSRNIFVSRVQSGGAVAFASDVPEISELITRKMREIYMSKEAYPYVDVASESHLELAAAREYFNNVKLNMNFFVGTTLFTWAGAKVNRTIALMCRLRLYKYLDYNALYVSDISPRDIAKILSMEKPSGEELAALEQRQYKTKQKYDKYLSDELMNVEYASTYLDVDKAWAELEKLASAGGYEEPAEDPQHEEEKPKLEKYDFRHIQDISNVIKYDTLSEPLSKAMNGYLQNSDLDCEITIGATFPGAPEYAMPINFLLRKGDKTLAVLLLSKSKIKRYSVQETEALCRENGIEICRFYFECDNEKEYVVERLRDLLD